MQCTFLKDWSRADERSGTSTAQKKSGIKAGLCLFHIQINLFWLKMLRVVLSQNIMYLHNFLICNGYRPFNTFGELTGCWRGNKLQQIPLSDWLIILIELKVSQSQSVKVESIPLTCNGFSLLSVLKSELQ